MAIYNSNETRTIEDLLDWNASDPKNAPFIKIGKLLLAVDQTGSEAWQPLIKELNKSQSAEKFKIYSGRHGALEGCFDEHGRVPTSAAENNFFQDDIKESKRFSSMQGVKIEVIDTGAMSLPMYIKQVTEDINAGYWVIVSWCHSIASVIKTPKDADMSNYEEGSALFIAAHATKVKRICDIANEGYDWVPKV